jgi:hypothetical protein
MKLVEKWRLYALQQRLVDGISMHVFMPLGPLFDTKIQAYANIPPEAVGCECTLLPVFVVVADPEQDQAADDGCFRKEIVRQYVGSGPARPERPPGRLLKEGEVPPKAEP